MVSWDIKRVHRILTVGLTWLSLLLCIAAAGVWLRSYRQAMRWGDDVVLGPEWTANHGGIFRARIWLPSAQPVTPRIRISVVTPPPERVREWSWLGVSCRERWIAMDPAQPTTYGFLFHQVIEVRCWLLVSVTAVLPSIGLIRFWRKRRLFGPGCCARCGYDLRATPAAVGAGGERLAVCPECGTPALRRVTAAEAPGEMIS